MGMIIVLYLLTVVVFFAIDIVWLGVVARGFYKRTLGEMLRPKVNWAAAFGFYLLYIVGIVALVVVPAIRGAGVGEALWKGALLGLVAYATYDLSNFATLQGWPPRVVVVDLVWGTVLTTVVSLASFYIGSGLGV